MPALIEFVKENCLLNKEIAVAGADNVLICENKMKDYLDYVNSERYNIYYNNKNYFRIY
jgi:hypothetical protein